MSLLLKELNSPGMILTLLADNINKILEITTLRGISVNAIKISV